MFAPRSDPGRNIYIVFSQTLEIVFEKRLVIHRTCAACSELPSNIGTIKNDNVFFLRLSVGLKPRSSPY